MIGMGTTQKTNLGDAKHVMSDFAVAVFGVMLAGMALYMVGFVVVLAVCLIRHYAG
jgi:hypothetical protein